MKVKRQNYFKIIATARHWWLMSTILATPDTEFRSIAVQGQSGQIVHKTLSRKNPSQKKSW
jgi:hypothetical protein